MGYFRHEGIVVNGYSEEDVLEALALALEIFGEVEEGDDSPLRRDYTKLVGPVIHHIVNGGSSFLIAPDGSKEGWHPSDIAEIKRKKFISRMSAIKCRADFALLELGGDDHIFRVRESSGMGPQPGGIFQTGIVTVQDPDFKRELDAYFEGIVGVVEATDCEKFYIWKEHTDERDGTFENSRHGLMCGVGVVGDMPVTLSLYTALIDGHKILFYHSPSQVVDHRMVRTWLDENCPKSAWEQDRLNHSDATNWRNVLPRTTD